MPVQIENFVSWIAEERREFHETQWHDIYLHSLASELRTCALQGRRGLLEGQDKIVIYRTSVNEATQYTGNWAWTFRFFTRSSDYKPMSGQAIKCVVSWLVAYFNEKLFCLSQIDRFTNFMHTCSILIKVVPDNLKACLRFVQHSNN